MDDDDDGDVFGLEDGVLSRPGDEEEGRKRIIVLPYGVEEIFNLECAFLNIMCVLVAVVSSTLCLPPLLSPLPRYVSQALTDMEEHGQRIFL